MRLSEDICRQFRTSLWWQKRKRARQLSVERQPRSGKVGNRYRLYCRRRCDISSRGSARRFRSSTAPTAHKCCAAGRLGYPADFSAQVIGDFRSEPVTMMGSQHGKTFSKDFAAGSLIQSVIFFRDARYTTQKS